MINPYSPKYREATSYVSWNGDEVTGAGQLLPHENTGGGGAAIRPRPAPLLKHQINIIKPHYPRHREATSYVSLDGEESRMRANCCRIKTCRCSSKRLHELKVVARREATCANGIVHKKIKYD